MFHNQKFIRSLIRNETVVFVLPFLEVWSTPAGPAVKRGHSCSAKRSFFRFDCPRSQVLCCCRDLSRTAGRSIECRIGPAGPALLSLHREAALKLVLSLLVTAAAPVRLTAHQYDVQPASSVDSVVGRCFARLAADVVHASTNDVNAARPRRRNPARCMHGVEPLVWSAEIARFAQVGETDARLCRRPVPLRSRHECQARRHIT